MTAAELEELKAVWPGEWKPVSEDKLSWARLEGTEFSAFVGLDGCRYFIFRASPAGGRTWRRARALFLKTIQSSIEYHESSLAAWVGIEALSSKEVK